MASKDTPNVFKAGVESVQAAAVKVGRGLTRQKVVIAVVAVLVVAAVAFAVVARPARRMVNSVATAFARPTLAQLRQQVKASPKDPAAHREYGHALFVAGRPGAGLHQYGVALRLDDKVANPEMLSDLVASYGRRQQKEAEVLIERHRLTGAAPMLVNLESSKDYDVRWGAMTTLKSIGKASHHDYLTVYVADLKSRDCSVKRRAVDALGDIGDPKEIKFIEAAARKDQAEKPWYWFSCLGNRPEHAKKEILQRI